MLLCAPLGSVAEWLNAPVLKTGVGKPIVSSYLDLVFVHLIQQ